MKLIDRLYIDELVYSDEIKPNHQKHMDRKDLGIFQGFDIDNFKSIPPPKNSSDETLKEMMSIEKLPQDSKFAEAGDDIKKYFKAYLDKHGLEFPKEEISTLLHDSRPILYNLKYHYNRPRPVQVADAMGLKFHEEPLTTAKTPSYPSGHSTQGYLIGKYLATVYPKHSDNLMKLANDISNSRLIAKVHFPSDSIFGIKLAMAMFKVIDDNFLEMKFDQMNEAKSRVARKKGQKRKSSKHSDLYTDEDPKGTIHGLGFKDAATAKKGIGIINKVKRPHAHKVQATLVMQQRAKVAKERAKDPKKKKALGAAYRLWTDKLNSLKKKTKSKK
jgi:acid phosphatase (class A)